MNLDLGKNNVPGKYRQGEGFEGLNNTGHFFFYPKRGKNQKQALTMYTSDSLLFCLQAVYLPISENTDGCQVCSWL